MIGNRSDFKTYFRADLKSQGSKRGWKRFLFDPIYRFTWLLRYNEYLTNCGKNPVSRLCFRLWFKRLSVKLSFSIPLNTFDQGFAPVHYGPIIVNPKARIGRNCRIHVGVNIGGKAGIFDTFETDQLYAPQIGNDCYIGPGAKLFGGIIIGDQTVIGANAVVNKSFPDGPQTLVGIPATQISSKGSEGLIIKGATP